MSWPPLEGIKVADFSALISGPFTAAILADLGADVIKVEPPKGDAARSLLPAVFHATNRNKRSIALDLSLYEAGLFCAALRHGIGEYTDPRAHIWPVNDLFETADGSVLILGIVEQHFWESFRAAVGTLAPALADSKFDTDHSRRKHGDELSRLLKTLFLQKTAREWHELLEPQDVPVELPLTPAQASRTEYARAREAVAEVDGERHVLFPLWANGRRAGGLRRGTPALNADGRAVLQEPGFAHDDIERILRSAAASGAAGVTG